MRTRAELMLDIVRSARTIAVDTETTGLDPYADHVIGVVVAGAGHSIYVPTEHTGGGNDFDDPRQFYSDLARAFALRSRLGLRTVFHNASFDLWMLGKLGIFPGAPLEDTMVNAVLIDDNQFKYSLADCCTRFGAPQKLGEELERELAKFDRRGAKNVMKHLHRLPGDHPLVTEYAGQDGICTLSLWQLQQEYIVRQRLERVHALECKLISHIARIRMRGIRIDTEGGPTAKRRVRQEIEKVRLHFPAGFNANKPPEVAAWMIEQGVDLHEFPLTNGGKPSTAKEFLETVEPGKKVLELRRVEKALGSFVEPLLNGHLRNGRIHPELVQAKNDAGKGTHTGRFSCRDPNMQQVPKRNRVIGEMVRPLIIPDPGMELGESDVHAQEVRLYAHYANERKLIEGWEQHGKAFDVHDMTRELLGLPKDTETHRPYRFIGKTVGLSLFNGMQAESLAKEVGCSVAQAQRHIDNFLAGYPAIAKFMRDAPQAAFTNGYVRTALGRICHLRYEERRMAVSRIIQGSGADQLKLLLLRACEYAEAYPRIEVLMPIHDSLLWQRVRGTDTTEFERVLEDNSELYQVIGGEKVPMRVAFPMDTAFGRNWSEASYGK